MFYDNVDIDHWYFHETWTILNRDHMKLFLEDNTYLPFFNKSFVPDENYTMYLLSINQELPNIRRNKSVFVNWGEAITDSLGRHPKNYTSVSRSDFYNMRRTSILFQKILRKPQITNLFCSEISNNDNSNSNSNSKMSVVNKVNKVDVVVFFY